MPDLQGSPDTGSPHCHVFFLFLRGEVLGHREGCKEGRAVSEILVTIHSPRPDARRPTSRCCWALPGVSLSGGDFYQFVTFLSSRYWGFQSTLKYARNIPDHHFPTPYPSRGAQRIITIDWSTTSNNNDNPSMTKIAIFFPLSFIGVPHMHYFIGPLNNNPVMFNVAVAVQ